MTMQRRLINLIGSLVVIVALVAGTLLMALPVYLESVDIRNEKAQVAASNQVLVARIDGLRAKEAEMPQLEEELGKLRSELPHIPQMDDVIKLALRAADKTGGTVQAVSFTAPTAFAPRGSADVVPNLPPTATDVPSADAGEAGTGDVPTDDVAADPSTDGSGSGTNEPIESTGADQLQVPVTITVTVPDTAAAARFLDELRAGPRLLQIDTASGVVNAAEDAGPDLSLTVSGLVFVQSK